ncbi:hypothetical protein V5O48_008234 [Marasmius crinis-equi]|uniref:Uncharacterized protein n=1 Tax=Marasmius crinis-equi TaxID=585013 RepID=A0ABR3FEM9_9AGAR
MAEADVAMEVDEPLNSSSQSHSQWPRVRTNSSTSTSSSKYQPASCLRPGRIHADLNSSQTPSSSNNRIRWANPLTTTKSFFINAPISGNIVSESGEAPAQREEAKRGGGGDSADGAATRVITFKTFSRSKSPKAPEENSAQLPSQEALNEAALRLSLLPLLLRKGYTTIPAQSTTAVVAGKSTDTEKDEERKGTEGMFYEETVDCHPKCLPNVRLKDVDTDAMDWEEVFESETRSEAASSPNSLSYTHLPTPFSPDATPEPDIPSTPHSPASFVSSQPNHSENSKDSPLTPSTPGHGLPLPSPEPSLIEGSDGDSSAAEGDEFDAEDGDALENVKEEPDDEFIVDELAYPSDPPSARDDNDSDYGIDDMDHGAEADDEGERDDEDALDDECVADELVYPSDPPSPITQRPPSTPYPSDVHYSTPDPPSASEVEGILQTNVDHALSESEEEGEEGGGEGGVDDASGGHVPESTIDAEIESPLGRLSSDELEEGQIASSHMQSTAGVETDSQPIGARSSEELEEGQVMSSPADINASLDSGDHEVLKIQTHFAESMAICTDESSPDSTLPTPPNSALFNPTPPVSSLGPAPTAQRTTASRNYIMKIADKRGRKRRAVDNTVTGRPSKRIKLPSSSQTTIIPTSGMIPSSSMIPMSNDTTTSIASAHSPTTSRPQPNSLPPLFIPNNPPPPSKPLRPSFVPPQLSPTAETASQSPTGSKPRSKRRTSKEEPVVRQRTLDRPAPAPVLNPLRKRASVTNMNQNGVGKVKLATWAGDLGIVRYKYDREQADQADRDTVVRILEEMLEVKEGFAKTVRKYAKEILVDQNVPTLVGHLSFFKRKTKFGKDVQVRAEQIQNAVGQAVVDMPDFASAHQKREERRAEKTKQQPDNPEDD